MSVGIYGAGGHTKAVYDIAKKYKNISFFDEKKKFYGVLNDGDLRRAILNGNSLNQKIKSIVNTTKFKSLYCNYKKSDLELALLSKDYYIE